MGARRTSSGSGRWSSGGLLLAQERLGGDAEGVARHERHAHGVGGGHLHLLRESADERGEGVTSEGWNPKRKIAPSGASSHRRGASSTSSVDEWAVVRPRARWGCARGAPDGRAEESRGRAGARAKAAG